MVARELLLWGKLHQIKASLADMQPEPCAERAYVQCLAACEWAVAITHSKWGILKEVRLWFCVNIAKTYLGYSQTIECSAAA